MDVARDRARDLLWSLGGLLLASGVVALEIRKAASWGLGGRMLVVMVPAVVLYALALDVFDRRRLGPRDDPAPWQTVLAVIAVFLNSIWLTLFFRWVGLHGSPVVIGGLAASSLTAWYVAWRKNVRFAALLGALDVVVAWLALWNKILGYQSGNTNRWLLLVIAAVLLGGAVGVARRGRREASELVTAAGVAGVLAAAAGVFIDLLGFSLNRVVHAVGLARSVGGFNARQHFIWDLLLLLIALGLMIYSARARVRGPGYIGAAGLFVFLFSIGAQISTHLSGGSPSDSVVGWPLALLLIGAAALVLGFAVPRFTRARGPSPPPEANSPPPPVTPPAP
jgi:hypothetical protein